MCRQARSFITLRCSLVKVDKFVEVQEETKRLPYKVVAAKNGDAHVEVEVKGEKKSFSPEEVSSFILAKLKADAESKLGE
ncbi:MAG: hypothetical protein EBR93_04485, partial [Bacteroidetes bacterium]|nr:hypothetical protein [Bacteroidota bacterium]